MKENLQAEATKKAYCDKASGLPDNKCCEADDF